MLCGAAICCISKRQRCVTTSTCWAELVALSLCAAEVVYVRMVLEDIGRAQTAPTLLFVDNEAAQAVARDPVLNSQCAFWLRGCVEEVKAQCAKHGCAGEALTPGPHR